ncbi:MAG: hypothetical protein ACYTG6_02270 [Planctomycetota bacterium]|jgi:small-conductance mechanosensitive channel
MSEGKRPGGLTALAVLNFVFGGLGALGLIALFALLGVADSATEGAVTAEISKDSNAGLIWISILLSAATVALMITAGVGYLGQKRFLGRTLGNAYAICSLAGTAIGLAVSSFGIGTLIGLIYPVLTLALINGTFKDDLVN